MKESHIYKGSLNTFISTIIHHKTHLHVWFSVVRVRAALIVASLGPAWPRLRVARVAVL